MTRVLLWTEIDLVLNGTGRFSDLLAGTSRCFSSHRTFTASEPSDIISRQARLALGCGRRANISSDSCGPTAGGGAACSLAPNPPNGESRPEATHTAESRLTTRGRRCRTLGPAGREATTLGLNELLLFGRRSVCPTAHPQRFRQTVKVTPRRKSALLSPGRDQRWSRRGRARRGESHTLAWFLSPDDITPLSD